MNIAVASADFETVTAHAGHARRFLVFEVESGTAPRNVARIELPDGMTIHEFSGEGPHPFDGLGAVIVGGAGQGFVRRLGARGIAVAVTSETDPARAVAHYVEGTLPTSAAHGCNCGDHH